MSSNGFSIITPVHNTEASLFQRTIASVVGQTLSRDAFEWIVVLHNCDGDTIQTAEHLLADAARSGLTIRLMRLDGGRATPSAPRNHGLRQAARDYLYFLDSDDVVAPDFLERALDEIEASSPDVIVAGAKSELTRKDLMPLPMPLMFYSAEGVYRIDNDAWKTSAPGGAKSRRNRESLGRFLFGSPVFLSAKVVRRGLMAENGIAFDEDCVFLEDILLTAQLCAKARRISVLTDTCAYIYVQREDSLIQSLAKRSDFTADQIAVPVARTLAVCLREDIDPNLYLWSVFEMAGGLLLKGTLSGQALVDLRQQLAEYRHLLRPLPYTGPEGMAELSTARTLSEVFMSTWVYDPRCDRLTLPDLIEESRRFDGYAITCGEASLTRVLLMARADALAAALHARGVGPGDTVALRMSKGVDVYAALMGVLEAGAAVVALPVEDSSRIGHVLSQTGASLTITDAEFARLVSEGKGLPRPRVRPKHTDPFAWASTSGSEGLPKTVCFTQYNAMALLLHLEGNAKNRWQADHSDTYLIHMGIDFLFGLLGALEALLFGKHLVVLSGPNAIYAPNIRNILLDEGRRVSIAAVPSVAAAWFADPALAPLFHRVVCLTFGGEGVRADQLALAQACLAPGAALFSGYATTETGPACYGRVTPEHVSCGVPQAEVSVSILDDDLNPLPEGERGRVCIRGRRVSGGYVGGDSSAFVLSRDGLNAFLSADEGYLSEGELVICGRRDRMLKLHGVRVDPSELEAALAGHPGVRAAAAVPMNRPTGPSLCAFYQSEEALQERELREYLAARLPFYMLPEILARVDVLPLTGRGKLDIAALEALAERLSGRPSEEKPSDGLTALVCQAFSETLNVETVAPGDSFFRLGGDSLRAALLIWRLNNRGYEVPLTDVFVYPTPALLAARLVASKTAESDDGDFSPSAAFPTSGIVRGYYEIPRRYREDYRYCVRIQFHALCFPTGEVLSERVDRMVRRHPALRSTFFRDGEALMQRIGEEGRVSIFEKDLTALSEAATEAFIQGFWHALDDGEDALLSVAVFRVRRGFEVLTRMAHVVVDAVSSGILLRELLSGDIPLGEDSFLAAQRALTLRRRDAAADIAFFRRYLRDAEPLRTERMGGFVPVGTPFEIRRVVVGPARLREIQEYCRGRGISLSVLCQYLYGQTLRLVSGKPAIILLCAFSGRTERNVDAVGNFFTILPVRFSDGMTLQQFQLDLLTLQTYAHTDADTLGRALRLPFKALGCAEGMNPQFFDAAVTGDGISDARQVNFSQIRGVTASLSDEGLTFEIARYADPDTREFFDRVEDLLRNQLLRGNLR